MSSVRTRQEKFIICALTVVVALFFFFSSATGSDSVSLQTKDHDILLKNDRGIAWDVRMNFSEPGGKTDYVIFGEATDANDGPPADIYDVVKPPAPIPPYIRTWFNDNIPSPYDSLWKDYRHNPDTQKTWNLSIQWIPPGSSPTSVTLLWNKDQVNNSEYDTVLLLNNTGVVVADLIATNSYTFSCPPWVPQAFKINCTADTKPPIISNHSPASGETGDPYIFNVTVIDDTTPANKLVVNVNWAHGGFSGNDTMVYSGGNKFIKTITLDNYSISDLSYHIYAKDNSKAQNTNYTPEFTATIIDDENPKIISSSTTIVIGTGDTVTLWVQATDNIGVTSAKATVDSVDHAMTWIGGASRWEYVYTAPSGSTASQSYTVTVYDAAANSKTNGPYIITVYDNDAPLITNLLATPSPQIINGHVNITATVTDNINVQTVKVRITGPAGFTPLNVSMTLNGGNTYYYNQTYVLTGVYNYSIWVKDSSNNAATSSIYQFSMYAEIHITTLLLGWNFISIPFNQTIAKTDLLIIHTGNEYSWSEAVSQGLILASIFDWNRSGQSYLLTNDLVPGRGYWMYAFYEIELWATGLNPLPNTNYITSLQFRWNIIGLPAEQTINKTTLIIRYLGGDYNRKQATTNQNPTGGPLIVSDIFGWKRTPPQGYIISTSLDDGYCYWMYSYYSCILKRQL